MPCPKSCIGELISARDTDKGGDRSTVPNIDDLDSSIRNISCRFEREFCLSLEFLVVGVWVMNDDKAPLKNITGGGLMGNLERIIPEGLQANIDKTKNSGSTRF
ncbi:MAG: hypothetical protein HC905_27755 [Bacteroidales bacterium]|nr:hypothetical protein [Bacteroidales bacterium]